MEEMSAEELALPNALDVSKSREQRTELKGVGAFN